MASSSRVFNQTFRFARNLKRGSAKVRKLTSLVSSFHRVTNTSKQTSQLFRPIASACDLVNGQGKLHFKTKMQFGPQVENCSMVTRSAGFYSPVMEASEDSSASCSEGDSSCEAMEGPCGDDEGLVIHWNPLVEDL